MSGIGLYATETWTLSKADRKRLEAFKVWIWRRMLKISWKDKVTDASVKRRRRKTHVEYYLTAGWLTTTFAVTADIRAETKTFFVCVPWAHLRIFNSRYTNELKHLKQMLSRNLNPEVDFRLYGRHLEKSIWRHNSPADRPNATKFGKQIQNDTPITKIRSKSIPHLEFQLNRQNCTQFHSRI